MILSFLCTRSLWTSFLELISHSFSVWESRKKSCCGDASLSGKGVLPSALPLFPFGKAGKRAVAGTLRSPAKGCCPLHSRFFQMGKQEKEREVEGAIALDRGAEFCYNEKRNAIE